MARPKALIIGAGALGLGFLAERMAAFYDLCLADLPARLPLLRRLARDQGYTVNLCGPQSAQVRRVAGSIQVVTVSDAAAEGAFFSALAEADLVLTAVGSRALPQVMKSIGPALRERRRRAWLLFCENGLSLAAKYGTGLPGSVTPMDTVMSRMCRFAEPGEQGYAPLGSDVPDALVAESYDFIPLDRALCGDGPFAPVFQPVDSADFRMWEDIKLFLHNGLHAFVAYHAFLEGTRRFPEVAAAIQLDARRVMEEELVPAILFHHPRANRESLLAYGRGLLDRFANPHLNDSIERGVRGAQQKLAPGERLLGGRDYIREAGIDPRGYATTIEAARRIAERQREGSPLSPSGNP